jgi:hypothetical protein
VVVLPNGISSDSTPAINVGGPGGNFERISIPSCSLLQTYSAGASDRGTGGTDWNDVASNLCTAYFDDEGVNVNEYNLCTGSSLSPFYTGLSGSHAFALRILSDGSVLVADTEHVAHINSAATSVNTCDSSSAGAGGLFSLDVLPGGAAFATGSFLNNQIDYMTVAHCDAGQTTPDFSFNGLAPGQTSGCGDALCVYGVAIYGETTVSNPTLITSLSSSTVSTGTPVTDTAILSGVSSTSGGAISFYYGTLASCPQDGATQVGSAITVSGPGTYGPSASQTFGTAGTYYWYAVYDPGTGPTITSACEPLTVTGSTSVPQFPVPSFMIAAIGLFGVALLTRKLRVSPSLRQ